MTNTEIMVKLVDGVDIIFYFISPENFMLKQYKMDQITNHLSDIMRCNVYITKCGPDVQNAQMFHKEISQIDPDKFEIVFISKETKECFVLSYDQKIQFIIESETCEVNSGILAKKLTDGTPISDVPEFI